MLSAAAIAADESQVTHLTDYSSKRVPTTTVAPVYPAVARRDRIEGEVKVCFNVDREGRPYRIAVRFSSNRVFERPAIRAVRASRYKPLPDDVDVPGIKSCRTFRFQLESVAKNQ